MEEVAVLGFAKLLSEVNFYKRKLLELEREVSIQVENMERWGLTLAMLAPRVGVAMGPRVREAPAPEVDIRWCKWWNGGFCKEINRCLYSHNEGDCLDHLDGRCKTKGCNKRHRKPCQYCIKKEGSYRGNKCQYLHRANSKVTENEPTTKHVQTETDTENEKIGAQTDENILENEDGLTVMYSNGTKIIFEIKMIVCSLTRSICSDEEWQEAKGASEYTNMSF